MLRRSLLDKSWAETWQGNGGTLVCTDRNMRTAVYQNKIITHLTKEHLVSLADLAEALDADFSTLYRNMQSLEEQGVVRRVVLDSRRTMYEMATHKHDHFVCTQCDEIEVIKQTAVKLSGHEVEDVIVRGRCTKCSSV